MRTTGKRQDRLAIAIATLLVATTAGPAVQARERVMQLNEDGTTTRTLATKSAGSVLSAATTRICEPNAKWLRLDFRALRLQSYDSLVLTSNGGDRYVFEGKQWNNRSFSGRAMRGSCVDIQPYFANRESAYDVGSYTFGTKALRATTSIVAGAGDICDSTPADCKATSDLIVNINPVSVFTAGDNAYESGTLTEYNNLYDTRWGRFKTLTRPTPGNHDYYTTSAKGYFDYFNGTNVQVGLAGDRSKGYYSYDVGDWHFIALNTMSNGTISSTQLTWLQSDLAANTKPCTAAYFHHPRWSIGNYTGYSTMQSAYDALHAGKVDLILVGHDHNYQRSKRMTSSGVAVADGVNGFRQVLVGTGGRDFYGFTTSNSTRAEVSNDNTHGVLKLTLTATGYTGDFVPVAGSTFTDTFTGTCNKAGGTPTTYSVSGTVTSSTGAALSGVSVSNGSTSVTTNASGAYTFSGLNNGTYTLTPSLTGYTFSPANRSVTVNGANVTGQNFTGTASGGGGTSQLLLNPGFELGNNGSWTAFPTAVITASTSRTPRTGTRYAWLGGNGVTATETLSQSVAIPAGKTSATLNFFLKIDTAETTSSTAYDKLAVQVRNSAGTVLKTCATYSNLNKGTSYVQRTCDLTPYIGQTVRIHFNMTEDSSLQTTFLVDDTALNVQ